MTSRKTALTLALATLLAVGCVGRERTEVKISRTWPAAGIDELKIQGRNGRVEIVADPGATEITMYAVARVRGELPEDELLEMEIDGNTLIVQELEGSDKINLFGPDVEIDFEFRVPGRIRLEAHNVNGRIEVDGVDARMELTTVNGGIEVATPSGELYAKTVNGSVRADFHEKFPGAKLKTVNGSVRIRVPRNCSVNPDVRSVNGSFRSDIPVRINSGRSDSRLTVVTVNGSVTLSEFDRPRAPSPPLMPEAPEAPEAPKAPAAPEAPAAPTPPSSV